MSNEAQLIAFQFRESDWRRAYLIWNGFLLVVKFIFCGATAQSVLGRLIVEVSRSHTIIHTHTHTQSDCSEEVIKSSKRPLLTQHTVNTTQEYPPTSMSSAGFETTIPEIKRLRTYAVDRTASRIRLPTITHHYVLVCRCPVWMNLLDKQVSCHALQTPLLLYYLEWTAC